MCCAVSMTKDEMNISVLDSINRATSYKNTKLLKVGILRKLVMYAI